MRADLFTRYAGQAEAGDVFDDWADEEWGINWDFARWLVGDEDAVADFARRLAEDASEERGFSTVGGGTYADISREDDLDVYLYLGSGGYDETYTAYHRWLAGDESGMAHVWPKIASETREIAESILPEMEKSIDSFHDKAGDLWAALPSGTLKQLAMNCDVPYEVSLYCTAFGQSVSMESDQEFRLTGIAEYRGTDKIAEYLEELEAESIHDACEVVFESEGRSITVDAVCDVEALVELVSIQ